jgi:threonine aldolase
MFGKEAAIYVPTGTMGNTIALKLHTEHGQEIICESRSHVFNYEVGMMAWFCGCMARTIATEDGILRWEQVRTSMRAKDLHNQGTGLVALENTHNMAGGTVYPMDVLNEICDGAHAAGLKVHLDGARVFNASAYLGIPVGEIAARVDSVMFCLSKGLGAPAGSMLVGSKGDIDRARSHRKRLGGGMRQIGVLAATGLVALDESPALLAGDHANA